MTDGPEVVTKRVFSINDVPDIIAKAKSEGWRELALIGPRAHNRHEAELQKAGWDDRFIFRLSEPLGPNDCKLLAALESLQKLDLFNNEIGAGGMNHLAALRQLETLEVAGNGIDQNAASAISALTELRSLGIWDNGIRDVGAFSVSKLSRLEWLNLGAAKVTDLGVTRILGECRRLWCLNIDSNGMGPDSVARILDAIDLEQSTTELRELYIGGNGDLAAIVPGWALGVCNVNSIMNSYREMKSQRGRRRFKVAFSFPGDHRQTVEGVAEALAREFGTEAVLYDKYHDWDFARPRLNVYLPNLYRTESELIVVVLCPEYATKEWCGLEWRQISQFILTPDERRVMFLSIGNPGDLTEIGITKHDGYMDIKSREPGEVAAKIRMRLEKENFI